MVPPEDGMVINDNFVCVIDGSTSKTTRRHHPVLSNGRYCMTLISEIVQSMPRHTTMPQFCAAITKKIRAAYRNADIPRLTEHPEERLTASCIVYSDYRKEVWMVGDCQALIDGVFYDNPKPYELKHAEKRIEKLKEILDTKLYSIYDLCSHDLGRDAILQDIIDSMKFQNVTYSVADGFPILMEDVIVINVSGAHSIVFTSDGYPFVLPTLGQSEVALTNQKNRDPLNMRYFKATKAFIPTNSSFDDRTYVRFTCDIS